jgi:hypothetical protein
MNWATFQTHNDSPERAFESMCNQLFERWCRRTFGNEVQSFRAINGAGGDGGVEAYAQLKNGDGIGHQAKWFSNSIEDLQIRQIHGSVTTAKKVRPQIKYYVICVPRNLASLKMGKGSQVVKNPEETRIASLIEAIMQEHSDLTIDLWDEQRILEELQQTGAEGIYRFWFDKEEITTEILKNNFSIAKSGWLRNRYTPALHLQGKIATSIQNMLRTKDVRTGYFDVVTKVKSEAKIALEIINTCYDDFNQSGIDIDFSTLKKSFENNVCVYDSILCALRHGNDLALPCFDEINFQEILDKLEEKPQQSGFSISIYLSRFKKAINKLLSVDIEKVIGYVEVFLRQQNTIIIGDPGTGKTHGLAHAVQDRLEKNYPAVIIQAKNAPVSNGWGAIMSKAMDLSNTWTSEEIWSALEACAVRIDVKRALEEQVSSDVDNENIRILICVDGVDESSDQEEWINRIGELTAIKALHPRICFCVSGRPHAFYNKQLDDMNSCIELRSDGDVPVSTMFDSYIAYYKIDTADTPWIKWAIQSPLALKLFCELHAGEKITQNDSINLSVSELIRHKLEIVEKELVTKCGNRWSENEAVALRSLVAFGAHFLNDYNIARNDASQLVMQAQQTTGILTAADAGMLIDHFCNCGLLTEYVQPAGNVLEAPKRYYQISYTQLTDYLIALSGIEQVIKERSLPVGIKSNYGSRAMVALMLLSDYDVLVGDEGLLERELPSDEILRLRLFALANVHVKKSGSYSAWVRETLLRSKSTCRTITEKLIIKVARQKNHPLGPILIHEVLKDIPSMAARDILWSVPDELPGAYQYPWGGVTDNSASGIRLCEEDQFDGLPLLFAWMLTFVDDRVRRHCRAELIKWGIDNISQLMHLLQLTFTTNDVQMKEDLASIACSVAYLSDKTPEETMLLASWAKTVAFSSKMEDCLNVVIRQSCRAIIEKAFELGLVSADDLQLARPPYKTDEYLLPIDNDVLEGKEHAFFPISNDLDRYVIKKAYEPFFGHYRERSTVQESDSAASLAIELIDRALDGGYGELTPELQGALLEENEKRNNSKNLFEAITISFKKSEEDASEQNEEEIDEPIGRFFEKLGDGGNARVQSNSHHPLAEQLLKEYEDKYSLAVNDPHKLVKAICYSFIIQWGWNYKEFIGCPNGEKDGEILGVDIAIKRKHWPATHGSRSKIMSFGEKYIWLAVHNIIGFFSDRLEFKDLYDNSWKKISDYNEVINIENSSREVYVEFENEADMSQWFLPTEVCPQPAATGSDKRQMLVDWIEQEALFNICPWLYSEGTQLQQIYDNLPAEAANWYSLNIYSISMERTTHGQSLLWATSFITAKEEFDLLKHDLENGVLRQSIARDYDAACSVKCDCYISPVDVVMMPWIQEINYISEKYTIKSGQIIHYGMYPTVTKLMHRVIGEGESEYKIPSKIVRQALGITRTSGKIFFDRDGTIVSFASELGENFDENQEVLFCRGDILDDFLQRENKVIFWIVRLLREADPAMKECLGVYNDRDRILLAWLEDGEMQSLLISDEKSTV